MATSTTASKPEPTQSNPSSSTPAVPPPSQQRLPPPFLFQGPPSLNTSNLSLPHSLLPGSHNYTSPPNNATAKPSLATSAAHHIHQPPLLRPHSTHTTPPDIPAATTSFTTKLASAPGSTPSSPLMRASRLSAQGQGPGLGYGLGYGTGTGLRMGLGNGKSQHGHSQTHGDMDGSARGDADALWQQMQNTLAEVELSAMNGDHVFGTQHARALEELRDKQLALALAWARSEPDEVVENPPVEESASATPATGPTTTGKGGGTGTSGGGGGGGTGGGGGAESMRKDSTATAMDKGIKEKFMSETTEREILLARKRREANDRYFDRVNSGVLDVVAKLEEVALAMRVVERESKEIWNETADDVENDNDVDGSDHVDEDVDVDGPSAAGSATASTTTSRHRRHRRGAISD
ncbi:hypothetical protein RJZ56_003186 [Blastomyces dermatitidis]|uniref:Uncharacterized protein n=3 Tax=Blastomyces TaxID=229219 RepID=A0A179UL21_BLAGS|nr:uncharacterized protein BDBG_03871 [Blastomyces gilchristii SLH14081]XP_031577985.1 hypothetical protein, variant [Blastomyces gilchristii SLH14081]XP_045274346.1 uncharacterized protein BDCG_02020 [Blastomyces dermatitidis ER-3]XP_045279881.1 hypothetical protein, variant [Blastomyces dermatitidis ER-3]EGE79692.1 hypothetical protein BDDG_02633 [Blastomyces dermatitidis ATCC 18188]EEQ86900.1 hypothetical protein BDCG_02020 [Blastomyces dermatitidis ER-3]KMW67089.1 hypothetical protein, va